MDVRPTKRCLHDLGLPFPDIAEPLAGIDHQLVAAAQRIPDQQAAGGAERVRSLTDRVWLKCKVGTYRGVVTELASTECAERGLSAQHAWWIGAAGERQADSPAHDFYHQIEAEAKRRGTGSGQPSTEHLLPQSIDLQRLEAELAALVVIGLRKVVLNAVARSLSDGRIYSVELSGHTVIAVVVRSPDGAPAYLAVSAEGYVRKDVLAIILSAVPGLEASDWQPEPGGAAGITPNEDQIIWSAIIPPEVQAHILSLYDAQNGSG